MSSVAILADAERMESEAKALYSSLYGAPPRGTKDVHRWRTDTMDRIDELREDAGYIRGGIESSREHIRKYYGLDLSVDLEVKHAGRAGHIAGFAGQYVVVLLKGDDHTTTCHATSSMEYPPGTQIGPGPDERFAHLVEV